MSHVEIDRHRMSGGCALLAGTRIPVECADYYDGDIDELLKAYPFTTREQWEAAQWFLDTYELRRRHKPRKR